MTAILIIEDNEEVAELYRSILVENGYEVDWARTGREAARAAMAKEYDLLIVDRYLEHQSGITATLAMRGVGCTAPAVVITGLPDQIDSDLDERAGIVEQVIKPVGASALRQAVERNLGKSSA